MQHRGVEVAKSQLPQIRSRAGAPLVQVGDHGAGVDRAELQMRRHPARAVVVGPIAVVAVVLESVVDELLPLPSRGSLARGQVEFDAGVGDVDRFGALAQLGRDRPSCADLAPDRAADRHPMSRHRPKNGVNTLYGSPSSLVTRPGETRYGDPVATSGTSPSAARTRSSRRRPYGAKSSETCTDGASISLTSAGIRSSGRPRVTSSRPSRSSRNWRSESHRNCIRRLPEDASKRGSSTKQASTSSLSAAARAAAGGRAVAGRGGTTTTRASAGQCFIGD